MRLMDTVCGLPLCGAGGFACRSNGQNQWSASKMNKFPKTVKHPQQWQRCCPKPRPSAMLEFSLNPGKDDLMLPSELIKPTPDSAASQAGAPVESEFPSTVDPAAMAAIAGAYYSTPFDVLGMHPVAIDGKPAFSIRTFQPQALAVSVKRDGKLYGMGRVHPDGFFEAIFPGETEPFRYQLSITLHGAPEFPRQRQYEAEDPYS